MNDITKLLDLEDQSIQATNVEIAGKNKVITIETTPTPHFCPLCGSRMYSKGVRNRTIRHPLLQGNYCLMLLLKQRRWRCTNINCKYESDEHFRFVNRYRRITNATELLVVDAFRNPSDSAARIANRFHISDTEALEIFDRFVDMKRLPLTDIISVDEVYINMDPKHKYALVLQDFHTGDPIDLLVSRRNDVTEPYFTMLPREEKARVKYLISDMYNPYISYVSKYFPNAVSVVDSFHVIQWIIHQLDLFLRRLLKEYKARDEKHWAEKKVDNPLLEHRRMPTSDEVYLLQHYRWLLLSNQEYVSYRGKLKYDKHFRRYMSISDYEDLFFALHPNIKPYRDLKEVYIRFNTKYAGDPDRASVELENVIDSYQYSDYRIFQDFAEVLIQYKRPILNSFILTQKITTKGICESRLSNGPIESMNRKVKDMVRLCRGFPNFDHLRNRFLFSTRKEPTLQGK